MFANLFPDLEMEPRFVCDGDFPDIEDFDAFIISGSKYSVYDDLPWIEDLKRYTSKLYTLRKKVLGVCFGHQMMAEALDGKVKKSENGYLIGLHQFHVINNEDWMNPFQDPYRMLMLCQDQVVQLPSNSRVLSKSSICPVAMFTVGSHFLGIQGHPEFTKEYNRAVFESRTEKIGQEKIDRAIQSFVKEPDTALLREYFMRFLSDNE